MRLVDCSCYMLQLALNFGWLSSLVCSSPPITVEQVAGGTDIVKKTMSAFCIASSQATALIDLHAYDGFPALAALEVTGFAIFSKAVPCKTKRLFMKHKHIARNQISSGEIAIHSTLHSNLDV